MKTLTTLSLIGALALSTTAFADGSTPEPTTPSASKQCRTERSAMGLELFRMTYGTNKNKHNEICDTLQEHAWANVDGAKHRPAEWVLAKLAQAHADVSAIADRIREKDKRDRTFTIDVVPLIESVVGDVQQG